MNAKNLAIIASMALAITACKKDEEPPTPSPTPNPTPTTATIKMSYSFVNGAVPFDPTVSFTDGQGRRVRITKLKFYAHDVHLADDDGATVGEFHDKIVLANALNSTNVFDLGTMDPGHIHHVEFAYGLDSASSYGFPDQVTAPVPLNDADMTWMWNTAAGRIFIKLEGFVDANDNGTEDMGEGFQYHAIGAAMAPVPVDLHLHADAEAGNTVTLALKVNVNALVSDLSLTGMFHNDGEQTQLLLQKLAAATSAN